MSNFFIKNLFQTIIYLQKNSRVCTQLRIRNKIDTHSRADAYIRRKRLISMSDYNLKSDAPKSILAVLRIRDVYPGSRILIFTHPGSRIPDPKTATKERGEKKISCHTFLCSHNSTKL